MEHEYLFLAILTMCSRFKMGMEDFYMMVLSMAPYETVLAIWLIMGLFWIIVVYVVYKDADKRGRSGGFWAIIVLFTGIFGLAAYAIAIASGPNHSGTPKSQRVFCHNCGTEIDRTDRYCNECGDEQRISNTDSQSSTSNNTVEQRWGKDEQKYNLHHIFQDVKDIGSWFLSLATRRGMIVGSAIFFVGYVVFILYFGIIQAVLLFGWGPFNAIVTFPEWYVESGKTFTYIYVLLHHIEWIVRPVTTSPNPKLIVISTPLLGGAILSWWKTEPSLRDSLTSGIEMTYGYFPAAVATTLVVHSINIENVVSTFSPVSFILIGTLYPVVFGAIGAVFYYYITRVV